MGCLLAGDEVAQRYHWPKQVDLRVNSMPQRWVAGVGGGGGGAVIFRAVSLTQPALACGPIVGHPACNIGGLADTALADTALIADTPALGTATCRPYFRAQNAKMGINQRDDVVDIGG